MSYNTTEEKKFAQLLHDRFIYLKYRRQVLFRVVKCKPTYYSREAVEVSKHIMELLRQNKFKNNQNKYKDLIRLVTDLVDKTSSADNIIKNFLNSKLLLQKKMRSKIFCCCDGGVIDDPTKKFLQQLLNNTEDTEKKPLLTWKLDQKAEIVFIKVEAEQNVKNALVTPKSIVKFCVEEINRFIGLLISKKSNNTREKWPLESLKLKSNGKYSTQLRSLYEFCHKCKKDLQVPQLLFPNYPYAKGLKDLYNDYLKDAYDASINKEKTEVISVQSTFKGEKKKSKEVGKKRKKKKERFKKNQSIQVKDFDLKQPVVSSLDSVERQMQYNPEMFQSEQQKQKNRFSRADLKNSLKKKNRQSYFTKKRNRRSTIEFSLKNILIFPDTYDGDDIGEYKKYFVSVSFPIRGFKEMYVLTQISKSQKTELKNNESAYMQFLGDCYYDTIVVGTISDPNAQMCMFDLGRFNEGIQNLSDQKESDHHLNYKTQNI